MQKLDDIDLITDEIITIKAGHNRKVNGKTHKVRSTLEKAHDDLKEAKAHNRNEIAKLRRAIKSHKILIRQAKNSYKLVQLNK